MIKANDKIERAREIRGEIQAFLQRQKYDDPWFYFAKAELRKALPKALMIELLPHQITVIDHDLTVHKN